MDTIITSVTPTVMPLMVSAVREAFQRISQYIPHHAAVTAVPLSLIFSGVAMI